MRGCVGSAIGNTIKTEKTVANMLLENKQNKIAREEGTVTHGSLFSGI